MVEKELTQKSLADKLGISERHVRNLCYKDTNISASMCYNLSTILGTSMESLLVVLEDAE